MDCPRETISAAVRLPVTAVLGDMGDAAELALLPVCDGSVPDFDHARTDEAPAAGGGSDGAGVLGRGCFVELNVRRFRGDADLTGWGGVGAQS